MYMYNMLQYVSIGLYLEIILPLQESSAGYGDHRTAVEIAGKLLTVDCSAHQNQTQIRALMDHFF